MILIRGALFMAAIMICGCASIGTIQALRPLSEKLSKYENLEVQASSSVSDAAQELAQLETGIIAKLQCDALFKKVNSQHSSPDTKMDLQLKATIIGLTKVDSSARFLMGGLAGRAEITIEVQLSEKISGKVLGSFIAEGKSSGGTIFAGTTPQAIDRVVDKIIDFVKSHM